MVEYDKHSPSIRVSTRIYDVYMICIDIVLLLTNYMISWYGSAYLAWFEKHLMRGIHYGKKFAKLQQTKTDCLCTNGHLCTLSRGLA